MNLPDCIYVTDWKFSSIFNLQISWVIMDYQKMTPIDLPLPGNSGFCVKNLADWDLRTPRCWTIVAWLGGLAQNVHNSKLHCWKLLCDYYTKIWMTCRIIVTRPVVTISQEIYLSRWFFFYYNPFYTKYISWLIYNVRFLWTCCYA